MRLLPVISLMMNSQESSATGYSPHELFMGRPAWFLHAPYREDFYSTVGNWVKEQQDKVDKAKAMLWKVRERQWNKKTKHQVRGSYQEGDWVLVHRSRLPTWPHFTSDDPYSGPYKILSVDGHRITMRCSPQLGGGAGVHCTTAQVLLPPRGALWGRIGTKRRGGRRSGPTGRCQPMEVEGEHPDMNAEEMAREGSYLVKSVVRQCYRQGWCFLTL